MYCGRTVSLIIPMYNEVDSIGNVLRAVDRDLVDHIVVCDNNSTDGGGNVARSNGAIVTVERRQGYGSACLSAIDAVPESDILVFCDADGCDDLSQMEALVMPIANGRLDLCIASRVRGNAEPGALTPIQRFGNMLACQLLRWFWSVEFSDLGPFRAISMNAYRQLQMADPDYGWTVEMQVKAAQQHLRCGEIPTNYRRRLAGSSKVSGTIRGSYHAGRRILGYVFSAKLRDILG